MTPETDHAAIRAGHATADERARMANKAADETAHLANTANDKATHLANMVADQFAKDRYKKLDEGTARKVIAGQEIASAKHEITKRSNRD